MDYFEYHDGKLRCEETAADELAARYGTPLYVYSQQTFTDHFQRMRAAFAELNPLFCFSIKSCQNVHICRVLHSLGSGFDVVSGGELYRALRAGADPAKIVFAGVGKTDRELREAFEARIGLFNIESESELEVFVEMARARQAPVDAALRVNPDVDPRTHKYTTTGKKETKFGVDLEQAAGIFRRHADCRPVRLRGIHLHIGSPVHELEPYRTSIERGVELLEQLRRDGFEVDTIDVGGGYGAHYRGGDAPTAADYAGVIVPLLRGRGLRVILEPGRSIAANAGIILTRVLHVKQSGRKRFVIVDAAMTELLRPALYGAYHFVWPVVAGECVPPTRVPEQPFDGLVECDVVGPVCESSDFLAQARPLPTLRRGDLLAVFGAGAYAMTMASQYNSRLRAAEVLVHGAATRLIRRRETYADLLAPEELESGCPVPFRPPPAADERGGGRT
ncbi:MAG: diaminopimelate decarboxylase [Planctomycetes bacterium]|nr:diaminopimelate decarboxylase [Planctomycetota bacterium]